MLKNVITVASQDLEEFEQYLYERENARATIRKYMTDIRTFCRYLGKEKEADKNRLLLYKEWLLEHYAISSANSMLAALNQDGGLGPEALVHQLKADIDCFVGTAPQFDDITMLCLANRNERKDHEGNNARRDH